MQTRVLVVEDDELQRSILQSAFKSRGYDVETAVDGLNAVWKARAGSYDVVIIDYSLPEIDGLATARLIHDFMGEAARPRLIALTATPDSVLDRQATSGDAFDEVVAKSTNLSEVLDAVARHLVSGPDREARRTAEGELLVKEWGDFEDGPSEPGPLEGSSDRILLVEDDLLQQTVLKSALARCGYEVQTTDDGLDAVRKIRERTYDLVLIDYRTPEIDGLAAARLVGTLLNEDARPRLIAVTAAPERITEWQATAGKVFDEVIAKPFSLPALLSIIGRVLRARAEAIRQ
jgi:CheY-like chemotaxis protein